MPRELCPDCGEPLTEADYIYPYKGVYYTSYWCNNCEDWKPEPKLSATRKNPPIGNYHEYDGDPVEEMREG